MMSSTHSRSERGRPEASIDQSKTSRLRPRMALGSALLLASALGALAEAPTSQAEPKSSAVWSLASDFATAPSPANPNPDQFGNPGVWQYLSASLDHNAANYRLLPEFIANRFGIPGLQGWQGATDSGGELDRLPHVSINTRSDNPLAPDLEWPAGTVLVHPLPDRAAAVGWRSPINGHVMIDGAVTDASTGCGDGISWSIDRAGSTLTGGTIANGGSQTFNTGTGGTANLLDVPVRKDDQLYFLVGPGPNGDHGCDSTRLDIAIGLARP
jgi:hypothetical protein